MTAGTRVAPGDRHTPWGNLVQFAPKWNRAGSGRLSARFPGVSGCHETVTKLAYPEMSSAKKPHGRRIASVLWETFNEASWFSDCDRNCDSHCDSGRFRGDAGVCPSFDGLRDSGTVLGNS